MLRIQPLKNYFLGFFIFGQDSYISFDGTFKKTGFYLPFYLPRVLHVINIILTALVFYIQFKQYLKTVVFPLIVFLTLVPNSVAIIESILKPGLVESILFSFNRIIEHLEMVLNVSIRMNKFEKKFRFKLMFAILVILSGVLYKDLDNTNEEYFDSKDDFMMEIAVFVKMITSFYIILLVDLLGFVVFSMNDHLQLVDSELLECSFVINPNKISRILRNIKTIHFKLWEISQRINQRFGFFLLVFFLETFLTVTIFIFEIFRRASDDANLPCKYFCFFIRSTAYDVLTCN